jgi:hypothetical protein
VPVFITAPTSAVTGTAAGPLTVQLQTLGLADAAVTARALTLTSSSPTGAFSTAAGGPWTPTLALPIAPGSSTASFYYVDAVSGTPAISATLDDGTATTQTEAVTPAPAPVDPGAPAGSPAPPPSAAPTAPPAVPPAAPPKPRLVATVTKRFELGHLIVVVHVSRGTSHPVGVRVRIKVRRGSSTVAMVDRVTTTGGVARWRSVNKLHPGGGYVATATIR